VLFRSHYGFDPFYCQVFDGRAVVARHHRIVAKSGQSVQLDHYLEVLKTKPGARPGSTALARAWESGVYQRA
jgi:hypothetical protein